MNFKIELDNKKVRTLLEEKNFKKLAENDQFIKIKDNHAILKNYSEGSLNFEPTYKYEIGSDEYD